MSSARNEPDWRRACERLSIAFANAIDHRDYPAVLDLFSEDGILDRMGTIIRGRAALAAWLEIRPTDVVTRHVCTNVEINHAGAAKAAGVSYFTYYKANGIQGIHAVDGPDLIGEYHDRYVSTPQGWKIAERRVVVVFQRSKS